MTIDRQPEAAGRGGRQRGLQGLPCSTYLTPWCLPSPSHLVILIFALPALLQPWPSDSLLPCETAASSVVALDTLPLPFPFPFHHAQHLYLHPEPRSVVCKGSPTSALDMVDQPLSRVPLHPSKRWSGVIGTGQSLSVGFQGPLFGQTPLVPGPAYKLHDSSGSYDINDPYLPSLSLVPFTEPIRDQIPSSGPYPKNIEGLSPHYGFIRQFLHTLYSHPDAHQIQERYRTTVHTAVGSSGAPLNFIEPGGVAKSYDASLFEARVLTRLAKAQGAVLEYDLILLTHGESDAIIGNDRYAQQLIDLHNKYSEDLKAITGQKHDPVMLLTQQNTAPPYSKQADGSTECIDCMWRVQQTSKGKIVCAGPKYQYQYAPGGLHLPAPGYDRLGEYYGEIFAKICLQVEHVAKLGGSGTESAQGPFAPLHPKSIRIESEASFVVDFHVPEPPLQWDPYLPLCHAEKFTDWTNGRGFELSDSEGKSVEILQVSILDDGQSVRIDHNASSNSPPSRLSYAMFQDADGFPGGYAGGEGRGRMGHLCDSSTSRSVSSSKIKCVVRKGSEKIKACSGEWIGVAAFDKVEPGPNALTAFDQDDQSCAILGRKWVGPDAELDLEFRHNLANYCVSFMMPLPEVERSQGLLQRLKKSFNQ